MKTRLKFPTLLAYLSMYQTMGSPLAGRYNPAFWSVVETWRSIKECNAIDQEFGAPNSDEYKVAAWRLRFPGVAAALDLARGIFAHAACDLFGHKYEDDGSYANGESARESFTCARCGDGFDHTYY